MAYYSGGNLKGKRILFFSLYAILLLAIQFYPMVIQIPPGDVTFATYNISQKKTQPEIIIKSQNVLGAVYYKLNNSYWLSYLTTTFDSRQQNDIDIVVELHNLNFDGHPNSSVVMFRDKVADGIDRYPYTNLQIFNSSKDSVIFSTIYRNSGHYHYQHLNRVGKIVLSDPIFDTNAMTTYFNPDKMMEINTTTIGVIVGKYLSENTSVTNKFILLFNRQTNQTMEIEMQFEISSVVFNQNDGLFYAMYDNQTGEYSDLGTFSRQGRFQEHLDDFTGIIEFFANNSTLLIRPYDPVVWGGSFLIIPGTIIIGLMIIVMIYDWRKQKKQKTEAEVTNPYLMNQNRQ